MGCRDIRETISAWVDGEASPEEAALVREHLASCERCGSLERQMRAVGEGVRQVRGSVPDRFREEVFASLESEGALPPRKREEAMRSWPFYRGLSDRERDTLRWFLFSRPGERPPSE